MQLETICTMHTKIPQTRTLVFIMPTKYVYLLVSYCQSVFYCVLVCASELAYTRETALARG